MEETHIKNQHITQKKIKKIMLLVKSIYNRKFRDKGLTLRKKAKNLNLIFKSGKEKIFSHLNKKVKEASIQLAVERDTCPDGADVDIKERFSHYIAIALTALYQLFTGDALLE
ncbi:MAG: hypothetical protein ISN64_00305 [Rickettsia sp.]|nr:hypothetical protein [Rickettsia sp.]